MARCYRPPETIRLGPQHEAELSDFLLKLDRVSRISRFGCAASDAQLLEHQQSAFDAAAWVGGVFVEQRLRGVVELYALGSNPIVEVELVVEPGWRRRGLGTAMLQAARRWAAENHRTMMRLVFSNGNWPMRKLAGSAGGQFDPASDEIVADIPVRLARRAAADWFELAGTSRADAISVDHVSRHAIARKM
jgi:GNAT superfamily N-acetyltransferase